MCPILILWYTLILHICYVTYTYYIYPIKNSYVIASNQSKLYTFNPSMQVSLCFYTFSAPTMLTNNSMPVRLRIVGCWCVQMWHYFRCYEKCFCEFRSDPRSKASEHTHTNNHFCANFGNSFERLD